MEDKDIFSMNEDELLDEKQALEIKIKSVKSSNKWGCDTEDVISEYKLEITQIDEILSYF